MPLERSTDLICHIPHQLMTTYLIIYDCVIHEGKPGTVYENQPKKLSIFNLRQNFWPF